MQCSTKRLVAQFVGSASCLALSSRFYLTAHAEEADGNLAGNTNILEKRFTATRHTIWTERMVGLANEMQSLVSGTEEYVLASTSPESAVMSKLRDYNETAPWKKLYDEGKTMWLYGPEFSTDLTEAMFLKMMAASSKSKRVLEVGMFMGYGTVAMAEGAGPGSEVVALEIDPFLIDVVGGIVKGSEVEDRITFVPGSAVDTIKELKGKFDMIFIDANKIQYKEYYDDIMNLDLLADDGLILVDNTLYLGYPYMEDFDMQSSRTASAAAIKEFNEHVKADPRTWQIMLPIRDGVTMIRKK